ncbi:MAG: hypothetical protein H0U27_14080 [Nitrosopumilus sp.]|nr:hypothetical protein [Nitrosopumilus sp.]
MQQKEGRIHHKLTHQCYFKYFIFVDNLLVETKKVKINLELEVDVPDDIVKDKGRYDNVKEGIVKSISKGLYEQGIVFRITSSSFEQ